MSVNHETLGAKFEKLTSRLETGLKIDKFNLDEELVQQPQLLYEVSSQLSLYTSRRDAAKQQLQNAEAAADNAIRRRASKREQRITEREIESRKRSDPEVEQANKVYLDLCYACNMLAGLKEAFQQRSYVLKDLVSLFVANYYSESSAGATNSKMKDHDAEAARAARRAKRKEDR